MNYSYLIIEDDKDFRLALSQSLERLGSTTIQVNNLEEAYASVALNHVDRVILDLRLGHDNGIEFLNKLSTFPNLQVLVLSGYASVDTVRAALIGGAVNFLQKPASIKEILKAFEGEALVSREIKPMTLEDIELDHINKVLIENNWNITKSAKLLGLHRRSLQRKIDRKTIKDTSAS